MTVENWLRGHFHGIGNQIERCVIETAALSPMEIGRADIIPVHPDMNVVDHLGLPEWRRGLYYALSTLYYSMSAAITGGTKSEKRGNRQISIGGYPLTTRDRDAFRAEADRIRRQLGLEPEEDVSNSGVMFDASKLTRRP